jgi:hypothetical protein
MALTALSARTSRALVRLEGEMGIELLTESSDDCRLIELIVLQELQRLSVESDVDLADGIVKGWLNVPLGYTGFEPWMEEAEAVTALHLERGRQRRALNEGSLGHAF